MCETTKSASVPSFFATITFNSATFSLSPVRYLLSLLKIFGLIFYYISVLVEQRAKFLGRLTYVSSQARLISALTQFGRILQYLIWNPILLWHPQQKQVVVESLGRALLPQELHKTLLNARSRRGVRKPASRFVNIAFSVLKSQAKPINPL